MKRLIAFRCVCLSRGLAMRPSKRELRAVNAVGAGALPFAAASHTLKVIPNLYRFDKEFFSTTSSGDNASPFASGSSLSQGNRPKRERKKLRFVPRKAAVSMTPKARNFFRRLLDNNTNPEVAGIMLNYHQSSSGEPRMVFSFDFTKADQLSSQDEGVSLEVLEDGVTPIPPNESENDGLPKLYIHHNAFMKVLGATVDVDEKTLSPLLFDREGNALDPNA